MSRRARGKRTTPGERLGGFYAIFEDYLEEASGHGNTVRRWRAAWQRRLVAIEAGTDTWPRFLVRPETTFEPQ